MKYCEIIIFLYIFTMYRDEYQLQALRNPFEQVTDEIASSKSIQFVGVASKAHQHVAILKVEGKVQIVSVGDAIGEYIVRHISLKLIELEGGDCKARMVMFSGVV